MRRPIPVVRQLERHGSLLKIERFEVTKAGPRGPAFLLAAAARSAGFGEDWREVGPFHDVVGFGFLPDLFEDPAGLAEVPGRLGAVAGGSQPRPSR